MKADDRERMPGCVLAKGSIFLSLGNVSMLECLVFFFCVSVGWALKGKEVLGQDDKGCVPC